MNWMNQMGTRSVTVCVSHEFYQIEWQPLSAYVQMGKLIDKVQITFGQQRE